MLWYGSRHFDPELGRFISPDSIVSDPYNPQSYDRCAYGSNNPGIFTGTILNREYIGSTGNELILQWNTDHPEDLVTE